MEIIYDIENISFATETEVEEIYEKARQANPPPIFSPLENRDIIFTGLSQDKNPVVMSEHKRQPAPNISITKEQENPFGKPKMKRF